MAILPKLFRGNVSVASVGPIEKRRLLASSVQLVPGVEPNNVEDIVFKKAMYSAVRIRCDTELHGLECSEFFIQAGEALVLGCFREINAMESQGFASITYQLSFRQLAYRLESREYRLSVAIAAKVSAKLLILRIEETKRKMYADSRIPLDRLRLLVLFT